ncbi:hypothetical protein BFP70_18195 [Thioclava sp. SK-1]|uniref:phosphotransferase enzyme family protein n=1 Tax=Thioclava sp. SK-1 TaxID=1889770 RepID=UPI0008258D0A|nr:phosphotransferase [Thioclava sp. SK-1]OCX59851.1 hypothetical protein BFP70_18195 [Thioclava sp. SK-1]
MLSDAQAGDLARLALQQWGGGAAPKLVKNRENIVFDAALANGQRVALRLHRPGYQDVQGIETELDWCEQLAAKGFPVPQPVRNATGALVGQIDDRLVSCVSWLRGDPIGAAERSLGEDRDKIAQLGYDQGVLLAQLHNLTDAGACPARFDRQRWDSDGLLGEEPNWGRFWENPALTAEDTALLQRARARAKTVVRQAHDIGPIHADVLRENVMRSAGGLSLIDFDDSGIGFRLYDLATAVVQSLHEPALADLVGGIILGYRSLRELPQNQADLLPVFVALRTFASAGWAISRIPADHPNMRTYAQRAVFMAQHVLDGTSPWP